MNKKKFKEMTKILIILSFLQNNLYGKQESVTELKKNVIKIESTIKTKNRRINKIATEKNTLEKQIEKNEEEIKEIRSEREKILEEIRRVTKNIDYSQKNLVISSQELQRTKHENSAKIKAWNRFVISKEKMEISPQNKVSFKNIIITDFNKIERVENVQENIKKATIDVEEEKKELVRLQDKISENAKSLDSKIKNQELLIKKLNAEKNTHENSIKKLSKEKIRIEKAIEKIILERTKVDKKIDLTTAQFKIGKISQPIQGKIVTRYGQKKNGIASNGMEIRSTLGSEINSTGAGKIIYSDIFVGLGTVVMIDYGSNLIGVYGNLISSTVKMGQIVKKGQNIGILGYSNDSQPDLYYELRFKLKAINPEKFY
ncbi:MAG: murein hydrolase activator EnvC family protein [Fusobacteriaceae bacterium]